MEKNRFPIKARRLCSWRMPVNKLRNSTGIQSDKRQQAEDSHVPDHVSELAKPYDRDKDRLNSKLLKIAVKRKSISIIQSDTNALTLLPNKIWQAVRFMSHKT